jgi:hypothetical protein
MKSYGFVPIFDNPFNPTYKLNYYIHYINIYPAISFEMMISGELLITVKRICIICYWSLYRKKHKYLSLAIKPIRGSNQLLLPWQGKYPIGRLVPYKLKNKTKKHGETFHNKFNKSLRIKPPHNPSQSSEVSRTLNSIHPFHKTNTFK